jgi:hypothetical protein
MNKYALSALRLWRQMQAERRACGAAGRFFRVSLPLSQVDGLKYARFRS